MARRRALARNSFPLLRLPPEIRYQIYRILADSHDELCPVKLFALNHCRPVWKDSWWNSLSESCPLINLRQVCSQLNLEAGNAVHEMLPLTVSFLCCFGGPIKKKTFAQSLQELHKWRNVVLDINDLEDAQNMRHPFEDTSVHLLTRFCKWWNRHGAKKHLTIIMDTLHQRGLSSELSLEHHVVLEQFVKDLPVSMASKVSIFMQDVAYKIPFTIQHNGNYRGPEYANIAIRIRDWCLAHREMICAREGKWIELWVNKDRKYSWDKWGVLMDNETGARASF